MKVKQGRGLQVERRFTAGLVGPEGFIDPLDAVEWAEPGEALVIDRRTQRVVFEMQGVEVPASWSQNALDIVASKYFRKAGVEGRGHEHSARQLVGRVSRAIRLAGERQDYFESAKDADAFEAELAYICITQRAAFNSPVWFNCGLREAYGITGAPAGNSRWDEASGQVVLAEDSYTAPQVSACFINKIDDDLMDIADHVKREMRIFKYGSGVGANYSNLRGCGEPLSNGGSSSGLMSFLEVFDRAAGAIKSGGTTRRAAKMVCLDVDHPDIEEFVEWKVREEDKARALMEAGFGTGLDGEAFRTVSGQNANNSVRVTDEFMESALSDGEYVTKHRTTGEVASRGSARKLLRKIADAAHRCADPGLHYDSTINRWHPCGDTTRINGSNPCSEYMYVDDSACNLASINLVHYIKPDGRFMVEEFIHTCRVLILAQEILVDYASYPTEEITLNSHRHRPLGLGYANLGGMLMRLGVPYDSAKGRGLAAAITSLMTAAAYERSAEVAETKGPFDAYKANERSFIRVMEMHRDAAFKVDQVGHDDPDLFAAHRDAWDRVLVKGREHGFRNAQATLLAPTGTIGLMMDCDTTGVEPDFSLVKRKKLAGGGGMKIVNQSVEPALRRLGYGRDEVNRIAQYLDEHETVEGCDDLRPEHLPVFDCANRCGKKGTRYIKPMGHIRMMEAVQPFLSGAISKTVNVPNEATVEDIERLYIEGWKRGLKALAIYRDESKAFQVLSSKSGKKPSVPQQRRVRLPDKRSGHTFGLRVGGQKVYLRTGLYPDDESVGEIFIDMHKEGAFTRSMTNCFHGDTRFFDGHRLVTLRDAFAEDVVVTCADGEQRPATVRRFGTQRFHDVVLKPVNGRRTQFRRVFTATKDHRWILEDGTVTQDIKPGDKLAALPLRGRVENEADHLRGLLHGFTFGDGSRHTYHPHRYRIRLCGEKDRQYLSVFEPLVRSITYPHGEDGDPMLYFESDIDMKAVPDEGKVSASYVSGFIDGWLAADGCEHQREGRAPRNVLCTQDRAAADWLVARAPYYGFMVVGFSVNNASTNYGERSAPLNRVMLAPESQGYVVTELVDRGEEGDAYCVVEPETSSFVLEGGVVTGNCFAIAISLGLQHGVPLETFIDRFSLTNFAPNGAVQGHPNVKFAGSVIDLVMRVLAFEYLGRVDLVQVRPDADDVDAPLAVANAIPAPLVDSTYCDNCGGLTRRNGTCYICDNCGTTTGCG